MNCRLCHLMGCSSTDRKCNPVRNTREIRFAHARLLSLNNEVLQHPVKAWCAARHTTDLELDDFILITLDSHQRA